MSSLKPRLTVLAALCSLVAITGPTPVQGSYMPMHSIDSSTGLISHSASMMSLSESTSMSHHQLESQTLPRAESSSEPSSRKYPRRAQDDRLPLRARRVAASRKDMKKHTIVGHGNGKGKKSYKKKARLSLFSSVEHKIMYCFVTLANHLVEHSKSYSLALRMDRRPRPSA